MPATVDDGRLQGHAVLTVRDRRPQLLAALSVFESAVVAAVDGVRDNDDVAAAVGVGVDDLRIALVALLHKGVLGGASARPALRVAPAATGAAARREAPPQAPARDDRQAALIFQAASLRALRHGNVREARALAEQAAAAAPGVTSHPGLLKSWDEHVGRQLGAELRGQARVEVVHAWVAANPASAAGWNLLATLLETEDVAAAADAAARAAELAPTPLHQQRARTLAARAGRGAWLGRLKAVFAPEPKAARGRR
ncbi:MAG: hypothetical protein HY904_11010 [Deltaproteobacteria bacterium]|nr:hypothetical protein [Deltaproteobacteria bacterium]